MTSFSFAGPPWTMHLAWKEVWTSSLSGLANSLINPNYLSISARILNLRIRSLSLILSLLKNALIIISTLDSLSAFPNPKLLLSRISLIKSFLNFFVGNQKLFHMLEDLSLSLAVSNAISTYHMSVYMIPKSICHKLDALMWKFWWRENQNGNSFIPKSWDTICISKDLVLKEWLIQTELLFRRCPGILPLLTSLWAFFFFLLNILVHNPSCTLIRIPPIPLRSGKVSGTLKSHQKMCLLPYLFKLYCQNLGRSLDSYP